HFSSLTSGSSRCSLARSSDGSGASRAQSRCSKASRRPIACSSINISCASMTLMAWSKVTWRNFCIIRQIRITRAHLACSPPARAITSTNRNTMQEEVDLEESIFAFSKAPDEQIGRVAKGGSTGAKVQLMQPQNGSKGSVVVNVAGRRSTIDVAENLGQETAI